MVSKDGQRRPSVREFARLAKNFAIKFLPRKREHPDLFAPAYSSSRRRSEGYARARRPGSRPRHRSPKLGA